MYLQTGLKLLMQRHALSSATLEDVLTALVDGLAAVSDSNDSGMLLKDQSLNKVRYTTTFYFKGSKFV